ncbi:glycosyl hydrolase [Neolewinella litorea]|uniref:Glycoside hydrolase n=1 Tax=Neolewinella litorea TaxID=2562452 RepID=A0A4S4NW63_9BACT|nr:glycosyl hydrolase [Neolewinella litorea]THH40510.1 glycoside hydrolase [Neolewinella litorea]
MRLSLSVFLLFLSVGLIGQVNVQTAKPWTYWWWMGSAVEREEISRQLGEMAESGLGGVHIIPIYGAKGYEDKFLPFLSEEWMAAVEFTIAEAEALDLGVDLTLGTGWPYGGPWITPEFAAQRLVVTEGGYTVEPTGQNVKRAAPGGEGQVMDYFSGTAVDHYLAHFDSVFARTAHPIEPRALYHDSYEVYGADWTTDFPAAFANRNGYAVEDQLHLLRDTLHPERPFLLHDIRATLADLLYTEFAKTWTDFSRSRGFLTRLQAHGSPGNILDLYGLADIPETESFGCSVFGIPGLACDPDYSEDNFGRPSALMMKFASSPAHLMGKPLVSSETATWLGNHFKVSLRQVKPQIDQLFAAGINHVFFHGTTYSPTAAGYPGWRFYASTNFGSTSHFYEELPLLNRYIQNCQTKLQAAASDNDVLLYFPVHDLWTKQPTPVTVFLDVHHYDKWFGETAFGQTARYLEEEGFAFDYVSDQQLSQLRGTSSGEVHYPGKQGGRYRTIVVPPVDYIPFETVRELRRLAREGVSIVFEGGLPAAFAGRKYLEDAQQPADLLGGDNLPDRMVITDNLPRSLQELGARQEELKKLGLDFIRKRTATGQLYFVTNLGSEANADALRLNAEYRYVTITDPLSERSGYLNTQDRFTLEIRPGQSYFLETSAQRPDAPLWDNPVAVDTVELVRPWSVDFASARTDAPQQAFLRDTLTSWTGWGTDTLEYFTGKATYRTTFSVENPEEARAYRLAFDRIHESAEVILNGVPQGTIWSFPNSLELRPEDLKSENELRVVVQNVSANYLRKYDREHPGWKNFYDINFVDITYRPFAAADWPLHPSGLEGGVRLVKFR